MVLLAGVGWLGALAATAWAPAATLGTSGAWAAVAVLLWRGRGRQAGLTAVAALVVFVAVATAAGVRAERVSDNPLTRLAAERAEVALDGNVSDDPRLLQARFGDEALVRLTVSRVAAGGAEVQLRQPVVVFAPTAWLRVPLGVDGPCDRASVTEHAGRRRRERVHPRPAGGDSWSRPVVARLGPAAGGSARPRVSGTAGRPTSAGAGARGRRRRRCGPGPAGRLPHDRVDPSAGRLRHQPHTRGRVRTGGGALAAGAGALAVRRRRGRDRRVCAGRAGGAERAEGGGDGSRGPGRDGRQRPRPWRPRPRASPVVRCCCSGSGLAVGDRVRALGPGDRRDPAARARLARCPGALAAALGGGGGRAVPAAAQLAPVRR